MNWLLSCCFVRELTDEDLKLYGASRVATDTADGRVWVRFPVSAETNFHAVMSGQHEKWKANILNISAGGVALLVDRSFDIGSLLNLEMRSSKRDASHCINARVIHCREQGDGHFLLGCTYVGELTSDEVESLL